MGSRQFITLNGVKYDAHTGVRLDQPAKKPVKSVVSVDKAQTATPRKSHKKAAPGASVHRRQQKSSALRRNYVKNPATQKKSIATEQKRTVGTVKRSSQIVRFAPHPKAIRQVNDIAPATPIAPSPRMQQALQKAKQQKQITNQSAGQLSSAEIKRGLISAAASKSVARPTKKPVRLVLQKAAATATKPAKKSFKLRHTFAVFAAIAMLGGYFTYINMPGLSVRIASAQSGVAASYPDYRPDGYRFAGPVEFSAGEVKLNFTANGGGKGYSIDQKVSGWNSVAVLDNLVAQDSNGRYEIEAQNGITFYTYDNKVVWSNGGVLYTIKSDAPLSKSQLIDIATSM